MTLIITTFLLCGFVVTGLVAGIFRKQKILLSKTIGAMEVRINEETSRIVNINHSIENAVTYLTDMSPYKKYLDLEHQAKNLNQELQNETKKLEEIENKLKDMQSKFKISREEFDKPKQEKEKWQTLVKDLLIKKDKLQADTSKLEMDLGNTQDQLQTLLDERELNDENKEMIINLTKTIRDARKQILDLTDTYNASSKRLVSLEEQFSELQKEYKRLAEKLGEL